MASLFYESLNFERIRICHKCYTEFNSTGYAKYCLVCRPGARKALLAKCKKRWNKKNPSKVLASAKKYREKKKLKKQINND